MKSILLKIFNPLLLPVLLCVLLVACNGGDSAPAGGTVDSAFSATTIAQLFMQSSWKLTASGLPNDNPVVWVEKTVSALYGAAEKCDWRAEQLSGAELLSCVSGNNQNAGVFEFVKSGEPSQWNYLPARPDMAFQLSKITIAPGNILSTHERVSYLSNEGKKGLTYYWTGCFENGGPAEISDIALRVWLMLRDAQGATLETAGKERRYTARSGIPRKLAAGEFFCTALEVKGIAVDWVTRQGLQPTAVIDARWSDSRGFMHIGPVNIKEIDPAVMTGKDLKMNAVIADTSIYAARPGKILKKGSAETLLFEIDRQEGRWLRGKSMDGLAGYIKADTVQDIFYDATPSDENQSAAVSFLKDTLSSLIRIGCSALLAASEDSGAQLKCAAGGADLKKRAAAELVFHPRKIKSAAADEVIVEAYFYAGHGGSRGRLFFGNFRLKKKAGNTQWRLAADERSAALLYDFIVHCLPDGA